MRTKKSIRNIVVTLLLQFLTILIAFFTRQYFISKLGASYLGLNGVFSSILSILSLSEAGFSTAFMFVLYKPIAEGDEHRIKILMDYFKRIYSRIGLIIFLGGLVLIPLLPLLIHTELANAEVVLYYVIYLAATSATYFFSYNKTLLVAYQDKYITSIIAYLVYILMNLIQVGVLYFTRNYYLFLSAMLVCNLLEGILVNIVTNKKHPFLKKRTTDVVGQDAKHTIKKNVKALFVHALGGAAVAGTDNLIISVFVGVVFVGLYSNYLLILSAINTIIGQAFAGITASVGDLSTTDNKKRLYEVYCIGLYINAIIVIAVTIVLWFVMNDFVEIWAGADFVLSDTLVLIILVNFLLNGMRRITGSYRDSQGLYWYDRYKPIFEAVINLIVSIVLVKKMGMSGVFIGTLVSLLLTSFWVEPYILYKYGFDRKLREYFIKYAVYIFIGCICFGIVFCINHIVRLNLSLYSIIIRAILYLAVSVAVFLLATIRTAEFAGVRQILLGLFKKR